MDKENKIFVIGMLSVIIGNLLGLMMAAGMVWADLEGSLFLFGLIGEKTTRRLDCPVLMTTNETREVTLTLKNPSQEQDTRFVTTTISEGYLTLVREIKQNVSLGPGETKELSWEIFPEDAVYRKIVLFRVYVKGSYPYPSLEANCGVLVFDIPLLKGSQVMGLTLGFTFLMMLAGNSILQFQYRSARLGPRRQRMSRAMYIMSILIAVDILISYLGFWVYGLILLVVIVMMIMVLNLQVAL